MSRPAAIEVAGLRKSYGDVEVLKGIDLRVERGEVVSILGPNGAGKTTLVEILEGYRSRSTGDVQVLDVDPEHPTSAWRSRIGLVLQECQLDPVLTVRETLTLFSSFYPVPRPAEEVIDLVGLQGKEGTRLGRLSGGQRRRADVAVALIGDPDLVFLDEPTTGFDPTARRETWRALEGLKDLGKTIVLTTHYMEEAQTLADRVVIVRDGEVVADGTPDAVARRDRGSLVSFRAEGTDLHDLGRVLKLDVTVQGDRCRFEAPDPQDALMLLTSWAYREEVRLADLEVRRPSLEDAFLELTDADAEAEPDPEPAG